MVKAMCLFDCKIVTLNDAVLSCHMHSICIGLAILPNNKFNEPLVCLLQPFRIWFIPEMLLQNPLK